MSPIKTILLCALALAAVIFLAIYEPLTRSTRENAEAARKGLVLNLDPSKVRNIRISTGVSQFDIKRVGNGWQLGTKPKDRADSAMVEQLLKLAAEMRYFDRIADSEIKSSSDLSTYSLRSAKRSIEFDGDEKLVLFFGKDAVSEERIYVRTDRSRDVFVVSDQLLKLAFRDAADFRDRRLTDLSPDQIDRVVVRRPDGEIELLRNASGWQITKPLHTLADERRVESFLKKLLDLRILQFVADDSGDLGVYGIAEGRDEISVYAEGSDRHQTLRLGTDKSGTLYGQFTARDSVYRLPPETAELLRVSPDDLRDRRLLPLNLDMVDAIRIRTPAREFALRRQGDGWVVKDGDSERPASGAAVQALADAVSTAEVSDYNAVSEDQIASFGLESPQCQVAFFSVLSENTPEARAGEQIVGSLTIGKSDHGRVFVRVGETPEVLSVPETIMNAVPLDPSGWIAPG
ncbi:MAG TPA: DUF4340 domain-containing protein [Terrimicrobiaceae bacterium]|nr:DUF4340 domain-containing protein [Terrimicrobiaceae bacterium]